MSCYYHHNFHFLSLVLLILLPTLSYNYYYQSCYYFNFLWSKSISTCPSTNSIASRDQVTFGFSLSYHWLRRGKCYPLLPVRDLCSSPVIVSTRHNKSESSFCCCHITVDREVLGVTGFYQLKTIVILDTSSHSM